tara:strand:+ start:2974 stop:4368 length:1395 start_codon:yes stop_codon:yes gene_type:complete
MQISQDSKINTLNDLINLTYNEYNININEERDYSKILINILKRKNYWPALQVKKFKGLRNQLLLHNTYIREDINEYKELYDMCRSVVLDFDAPSENIVVSYSNSIPIRMNIETYIKEENDKYLEAYDGTMVTCYYYNDKWHMGTTSCPDINSSWFSHPTKSHGIMLDEVLYSYSNKEVDITNIRNEFTKFLDKNISYVFVLLHYENKHIIDYSDILGNNYMHLVHIDSKNIKNHQDVNLSEHSLQSFGIIYPKIFNDINEANNHILDKEKKSYGFIVKRWTDRGYSLAKISPDNIRYREETDPCNPNPWYNILTTYMKNRIDYHINDYIRDYNPNIEILYDNNSKVIDPTYLVHTSICTIKDQIHKLYLATTSYNAKKNLFKMNKEIDKHFVPLIRFHLGRLRHRQVTVYKKLITGRDVYYYICHCLRPTDVKQLLNLFTTSSGYDITERSMLCLVTLNKVLNY